MIGLLLHTFHEAYQPCDDTYGVYINRSETSVGVFKNSECRVGVWGAWAPETNALTVGPTQVKAGLMVGAVFGYKYRPVSPLLVPSVAVSLDGQHWIRVSHLPSFRGSTSGVTLSVEFNF